MLADSHPNIVVSFQVNDENLMWSILLSYIYLVALLASHVWSVPFKKAPFYFSSISVAIHYLLYYNFLLGILHYAAYVCKTDLWSLLCTGSFIGEALQDIWEMLNEFTSDLSTESRQTGAVLLLLDCKVHWGILVDWFYLSVNDVSMICRKKESWRFCMLLVDQLMVLCVVKKEFRNESTTIWSLPGLLVEA